MSLNLYKYESIVFKDKNIAQCLFWDFAGGKMFERKLELFFCGYF